MNIKKYLVAGLVIATFAISFSPALAVTNPFVKTFGPGATGNTVLVLQQFLVSRGLLAATPNGIYGPLTKKAVTAFQLENGLTPTTGGVGPLTMAALNAAFKSGGGIPTTDVKDGVPAVATLPATDVTSTSAVLHGSFASSVSSNTTAGFKYGKTLSYGLNTKASVVESSTIGMVTGLACGTTYKYAATATVGNVTTNGAAMSFMTLACR